MDCFIYKVKLRDRTVVKLRGICFKFEFFKFLYIPKDNEKINWLQLFNEEQKQMHIDAYGTPNNFTPYKSLNELLLVNYYGLYHFKCRWYIDNGAIRIISFRKLK